METTALDRDWFLQKLEKADKSIRALARHLNVDAAAVSRMLSGKRKMKLEEAEKIARFLEAPLDEVLKRAGMVTDGAIAAQIMLAATIGDSGEVKALATKQELPEAVVIRAQSTVTLGQAGHVIAAQVRASKGALSIWDDAVVLFMDSIIVEPAAVGVLSVAKLRDGITMLAHIEKARKTGEATIKLPNGDLKEVLLQSATPVLAVIP